MQQTGKREQHNVSAQSANEGKFLSRDRVKIVPKQQLLRPSDVPPQRLKPRQINMINMDQSETQRLQQMKLLRGKAKLNAQRRPNSELLK